MSLKNAMMLANKMSQKKAMSHGGKCYACGGQVNPELQQSRMAKGGKVTEQETEHRDPLGSYKEVEHDENRPEWGGFEVSELPQGDDQEDIEPHKYAQGGGVDEQYEPHSINDPDGDNDDLVQSPEKYGEEGFGDVDNQKEDADDNGKKSSFLRAYMIHRRLRG